MQANKKDNVKNESDAFRQIPYVDLAAQFNSEKQEIIDCMEKVCASGAHVGLYLTEGFEKAVAEYCGVPFALAVSSGTDALFLALRILDIGPGDEVITVPNTHFATVGAIVRAGAIPVFVDVQDDQNICPELIEAVITPKTKALLPVHLTGRACDMDPILEIARARNLKVIEDAAQAIGSKYKGTMAGSFGDVAAFSAHPLKNLNAIGDAGYMVIHDPELLERASRLRNHGLKERNTVLEWGGVARMDALQAEILKFRLTKLDSLMAKRQQNAGLYAEYINTQSIFHPVCRDHEFNTYHIYVIQAERRDELISYLDAHGVGTAIHYPIPLHLQPAAGNLGYKKGDFPNAERQAEKILSLPVHQFLSADDIKYISGLINKFYET